MVREFFVGVTIFTLSEIDQEQFWLLGCVADLT
jgi:hypothetical protein